MFPLLGLTTERHRLIEAFRDWQSLLITCTSCRCRPYNGSSNSFSQISSNDERSGWTLTGRFENTHKFNR